MTQPHVVVCAGETSGDSLAAGLIRALSERRSDVAFSGMGGEQMRAAGANTLIDVSELAVMGLWEVLTQYARLRRLLRRMQRHLEETRPRLLVLVDYVEFNLRLGEHARRLGIPVLFYVSPQVWAWRQKRIHRIRRCVDAMAVLFPFEETIYREQGIPVRYVGNPLVDRVQRPRVDLRAELQLDPATRVVGLLPGSRSGELRRHWPVLVATARCLHRLRPDLHFAVPLASGVGVGILQSLAPYRDLPISTLEGNARAHQVMAASELVLISSGTATLEAALLRTPMIVIYRMAPLSYALFSRLIRVPHVALANIVAGRRVVPERLQRAANPEALCREALDWLDHPEKLAAIRESLDQVRQRLGPGGADRRVAETALEMLERGRLDDPP
ncbi:Lipid-A-disaccharide synthase [Thioalkalivibrio nitratireducens DSM 14787]|uniref:Lipid-A-disaccharide synthase n=1 Tax=Thioalkalivibrio nitratireducens (strain DSM 14787 / UNIQEM 213 / ALEN2) TaxID=1255043 RepID=L0DWY3_THIND|nr:lipid-A-disaccharide synthase [Thioalkalivibrio nitratireducens]AGA33558.1 Lipid-A-disaccharide synthase [Thioalkalivibrio nitratireducens DSM 14787]